MSRAKTGPPVPTARAQRRVQASAPGLNFACFGAASGRAMKTGNRGGQRRRRDLLELSAAAFLASGAAATWPIAARAQQLAKVFRIGILSPAGSPSTKAFGALREGLRALGYIDGVNIAIEYRLAAGDYDRLPAMAADLVGLPVDLIVTDSGIATQIAQQATRTIPIVAATIGEDPVGAGRAASLAHPGGNVTGFTGFNLAGKRVELLKETLPEVSRIAALWNPAMRMSSFQATEEAARALSLQLRPIAVAAPDEIPTGFEAAVASGVEALVVLPDGMFWNERIRIVALAAQYRLPAIYEEREYANDGGLISYGRNVSENFRQAAGYVARILKGAKPSDLPVQRPTRFDLVVNLKTARALGVTIPESILARADEVIE
jgi:putative ABC transport system substrate-binding protein